MLFSWFNVFASVDCCSGFFFGLRFLNPVWIFVSLFRLLPLLDPELSSSEVFSLAKYCLFKIFEICSIFSLVLISIFSIFLVILYFFCGFAFEFNVFFNDCWLKLCFISLILTDSSASSFPLISLLASESGPAVFYELLLLLMLLFNLVITMLLSMSEDLFLPKYDSYLFALFKIYNSFFSLKSIDFFKEWTDLFIKLIFS